MYPEDNFRKKIIILAIVLFVIVLAVILFVLFQNKGKSTNNGPVSVPIFDNLNSKERTYPVASPPNPLTSNSNQVGQLVISTIPDGVRATIDPPSDEAPANSIQTVVYTTPVTIPNIQVGSHKLSLFKDGFTEEIIPFTIENGKLTRIEYTLKPLPNQPEAIVKGWVNKLPLKNEYYYIDYDPDKAMLRALIYPISPYKDVRDAQIALLKQRVLEDLANNEINTTEDKIEWIVK